MSSPVPTSGPRRFRFGVFAFDASTGELVKGNASVVIRPQPSMLLNLLLLTPGELVSRERIRHELWGAETTVDFEIGMNRCVRQLRAALLDDSDAPRYIETLPRRGYRFIAPVFTESIEEIGPPQTEVPRIGEPAAQPSIAVLPFSNFGGETAGEYFSDGLAEEIINALAQIDGLKVIARTSAFAFKGRNEDIRSIAGKLGVSMVLEGSVRRDKNRIRVTSQLIRAVDGAHLSSRRYDRELSDVFALQDEIAANVAAQLRAASPSALGGLPGPCKHPTKDLAAYEALLEGRFHWNKFTPESFGRALECYKRAVRIDPRCAAASAGIAQYYLALAIGYLASPLKVLPQAAEAAQRAIDLDESNAEGHWSLAVVSAMRDYDWAAAERHFGRARALTSDPQIRIAYALVYLIPQLRLHEAVSEIEKAILCDPLLLVARTAKSVVLFLAREYNAAAECCRRALEIDSNFPPALYFLAYIEAFHGNRNEALDCAHRLIAAQGRTLASLDALGVAQATAGEREAAQAVLRELRELPAAAEIGAMAICAIHALLNDKDAAFEWLDRAIQEHDPRVPRMRAAPWLDSLRSDARFGKLLRRTNLFAQSAEAGNGRFQSQ